MICIQSCRLTRCLQLLYQRYVIPVRSFISIIIVVVPVLYHNCGKVAINQEFNCLMTEIGTI